MSGDVACRISETMKTILVAIRETEAFEHELLPKFIRLALALKARVELLTVVSPLVYDSVGIYAELIAEAQRTIVDRATVVLGVVADRLRAAGIAATVRVDVDLRAHEAIARRAETLRPDLVVVGCHSPHRLAGLLQYTDWELVRLCPAPLLLVKDPTPWPTGRVLAAIDPTHAFDKPAELDHLILQQAVLISSSLRSELHLVHANPVPPLMELRSLSAAPDVLATLRSDAEARTREACDRLIRASGVTAQLHLSTEVPSQAIAQVARQCHADIVVMGVLSRSAPKRWLLGDTALKVLDHVRADVLVVKSLPTRS